MPRKSSITFLPKKFRDEIDRLIREGGYTLDDIITRLREMGDKKTKRSALGRYKQKAEEQMKRFLEIQEVAKVWTAKLEESPNSEYGQLLSQLLRTATQVTIGNMLDRGEEVDASEIMLIGRAIKDLASADKLSVERELKVRREVVKAAAEKAAEVARRNGATKKSADELRREILGVVV